MSRTNADDVRVGVLHGRHLHTGLVAVPVMAEETVAGRRRDGLEVPRHHAATCGTPALVEV